MLTPTIDDVSVFLSEISERDRNWDLKKAQSSKLAKLYKNTQFNRLYERMSLCAERLRFDLASGKYESSFKLKDAYFCRVRHCPICQWRRVRMWFGRFINTLPKMLEDYPSARFVYLTLTVRNCEVSSLRATLADMNKAWQRLSQRKEFKSVLGWVKSVEFTRNNESNSLWFNTVHPHFHVLLMVKPSYFTGKSYVSQEQWVRLWRECLRVDYDPSVNVKAIKPKGSLPSSATPPFSPHPAISSATPPLPSNPPNVVPLVLNADGTAHFPKLPNAMVKAVSEVVKYSVKPQDLVLGGEWLVTLTEQLRGTKAIALGGVMRDYIKEPDDDDEDLITAGLESEDAVVGEVAPVTIAFGWRERLKRYQQIKA
jgi:plasmid rolling circle replication initiator protein Rep